MSIDWPEFLPSPLIDLTNSMEPNLIVNKMESGDLRQRKQFTVNRESYNIAIITTFHGYAAFKYFHSEILAGGANKFSLPLPQVAAIALGKLEGIMANGAYSATAIAGTYKWRIEFSFIFQGKDVIAEQVYNLMTEIGVGTAFEAEMIELNALFPYDWDYNNQHIQ